MRTLKKSKRIKPISDKQAKRLKLYLKLKAHWWAKPENKFCKAPYCKQLASELHHQRGRYGIMLNLEQFWIPLCHECHRLVHAAPAWGRAKGLLGPVGSWNNPK